MDVAHRHRYDGRWPPLACEMDGATFGAPGYGTLELIRDAQLFGGFHQELHQPPIGDDAAIHKRDSRPLAQFRHRAYVFLLGQIVAGGAFQRKTHIGVNSIGSYRGSTQAHLLLRGKDRVQIKGIVALQQLYEKRTSHAVVEGLALDGAQPLLVQFLKGSSETGILARMDALFRISSVLRPAI